MSLRSEHRPHTDNNAKIDRPGLIRNSLEDVVPTNDEIIEKVRSTLVDALGVDEDDVTPDATLFKDLGAESIDLLDIVFRLERNFGIRSRGASCSPRTSPTQSRPGTA